MVERSSSLQDWFEKMTKEFQLNGRLSFLRCHDGDDGTKRMEMMCRRCGELFDTPDQFSNHVIKHIGKRILGNKLTFVISSYLVRYSLSACGAPLCSDPLHSH